MVFWNTIWYPICGHYFWNNQIGATLFCQEIGYNYGNYAGKESGHSYLTDSFRIGQCNTGDVWKNCSGGCNDYQGGGKCNDNVSDVCTVGQPVKITIRCEGNSTISSSCKGKMRFLFYF